MNRIYSLTSFIKACRDSNVLKPFLDSSIDFITISDIVGCNCRTKGHFNGITMLCSIFANGESIRRIFSHDNATKGEIIAVR